MLDQIGSKNMVQGSSTYFTSDRFGCPNSALALNGGWTHVPSGIYFNTPEFTISVWVYPQHVGNWSRIIDFGNGVQLSNILLSLSDENSLAPFFEIYSGSKLNAATSSQKITLNQWQLFALTFNGIHAYLYLNGTLTAKLALSYILPTLERSHCYIGKSNWPEDGYSSSYLDDLRFYNKSLTQTQIIELMSEDEISECSTTHVSTTTLSKFKIFL